MLVERVRDQFLEEVITRGDKLLVESARIEDATIEDDWLMVEFDGSEDATAQLILCEEDPFGDHIHVHCSCQSRKSKDLCAHLWAIVRFADSVKWCNDIRRGTTRLTVTKKLQDEDSEDCYPDDYQPSLAFIEAELVSQRSQAQQSQSISDWHRIIEQAQRDTLIDNNLSYHSPFSDDPNRVSEIIYMMSLGTGIYATRWHIEVWERKMRSYGKWHKPKRLTLNLFKARNSPHEQDINFLNLLIKSDAAESSDYAEGDYYQSYGRQYTSSPSGKGKFTIPTELVDHVLSQLTDTRRLYLEEPGSSSPLEEPLTYTRDEGWSFALIIETSPTDQDQFQITGEFRRDHISLDLRQVNYLLRGNLMLTNHKITALGGLSRSDWYWAERLHTDGPMLVPKREFEAFLTAYSSLTYAPLMTLKNARGWELIKTRPVPRLSVLGTNSSAAPGLLSAQVCFDYDGRLFGRRESKTTWIDLEQKQVRQRSPVTEFEYFSTLMQISEVKELPQRNGGRADIGFPAHNLPLIVSELSSKGWHIEAEGRRIFRPSEFSAGVSSGTNWFDLKAQAKFGNEELPVPQLLRALQRGQTFITLGNGDLGLLPEEWLAKFAPLLKFGKLTDDGIRFKSQQGALLDALIDQLPQVNLDEKFAHLRLHLKQNLTTPRLHPSSHFKGRLRNYQTDGLAWLSKLHNSGFGGCLADDMGLGKTIQVLAFLASQKSEFPSIIIVPRSLVHNWINESNRFCPTLRVLDYSHDTNRRNFPKLRSHDVIIITYGMLRQDIEELRKIDFNYVILDEAQAIKNIDSLTSKATRLLKSKRRLALTGTPVENHLGELGAIFEFLNPDMLSISFLKSIAKMNKEEGNEAAKLVGRALRPFILRRTKDEVLKDLPPKIEQTLYCDLEPSQRRQYDELLEHYRKSISQLIKKKALNRSRLQVVEALLRLRQAACHPGLIDPSQSGATSGKLELLMNKLHDVIDSGHKALVFSQFTSMLSLVKSQLVKEEISHEYLDGRTSNREERINRFQQDPTVGVFLISLKAGGVGLNLTAADYCFLLDPWWNPAAESQAIDRIHRMGQAKPVFAYRIIARDTIEEKLTALQANKRALADSIFTSDSSGFSSLNMDDLKILMDLG